MSDHTPHGASTIKPSKGSGGGGGPGKWILGGLAAVVLAGGGYAAWKTVGPGAQNTQQSAYEDTYADDYASDDSTRAAPLPDDDGVNAESASADDNEAAPAASEPRRSTTARRSAPTRTVAAAEETIGITPVNATTDVTDGDDIVVRGARRPVWASTPSERRLTSLYPERARMRGREGEARLQCTVEDGGALDCTRAEETSAQFGVAAMRVARDYRHASTLRDGSDATGTPVNLRVVFRLEDDERGRYASR